MSLEEALPLNSGFKIAYQNVEGLNNEKLHVEELLNLLDKCDIIGFGEVWRRSMDGVNIPIGWELVHFKTKERRSRFGRTPGGIAVLIRASLKQQYEICIPDTQNEDVIWVSLVGSFRKFIIGVVYNPADNSVYRNESFLDELEYDICHFRDCGHENIAIVGDFNCRTGEVKDIEHEGQVDEYTALPEFYEHNIDLPERTNMDKKIMH